jgi:hypothetical protein
VEGTVDKDGEIACHVIGQSEKFWKKIDAAFHAPVARHIMKIRVKHPELEEELEEREPTESDAKRPAHLQEKAECNPDSFSSFSVIEKGVRDWIDNCKAQCERRKNFSLIAKHAETVGG